MNMTHQTYGLLQWLLMLQNSTYGLMFGAQNEKHVQYQHCSRHSIPNGYSPSLN